MTRLFSFPAFLTGLVLLVAATPAAAGEFSPTKVSKGDWAKYLVSTDNKTQPILSQKDQPTWRFVSAIGVGDRSRFVRVETIKTIGGRKTGPLGDFFALDKPYEPLFLASAVAFEVASTSSEAVTVKGKTYACKKIVRKVNEPEDLQNGRSLWKGTSTIWLSDEAPLGLVKMVNDYEASAGMVMKLVETWVLDGSGFKNWKGEQ